MSSPISSRSITVTNSQAPLAHFDHAENPRVSFIIVSFGTGPIIIEGLGSLAHSFEGDPDIAVECIVVNNLHPDAPGRARRELLMSTSGVRLIDADGNLGFGGGCELGALHARGDVLAFVNPDVSFQPGWLGPLLETLADPLVSIVAPILVNPDGSVQEAGQRLDHAGDTAPITTPVEPGATERCDFSSAACWLMSRDEHERLGGFDPAYHPAYYEDADLALRAASLGGRSVVNGSSRVVHRRGSSTATNELPDVTSQRAELLRRWPGLQWRRSNPD